MMSTKHVYESIVAQLRSRFPLTRYDFVLTLLPVAFMLTVGVASLADLPTRTALVGWSVVGFVVLVDALFLNPPTTGGRAD
jgi:hypothetical protein